MEGDHKYNGICGRYDVGTTYYFVFVITIGTLRYSSAFTCGSAQLQDTDLHISIRHVGVLSQGFGVALKCCISPGNAVLQ